MNPKDIQEIVSKVIEDQNKTQFFIIIGSILLAFLFQLVAVYYKARSLNKATKNDIGKITSIVEDVKAKFNDLIETEKLKRNLKYDALQNSLNLIDSYISNFILDSTITKQYSSTEETRKCHNSLILTCDNSEIILAFERIMMDKKPTNSEGTQFVLKELARYRTLIRTEMGFGPSINTHPDKIWIGSVPYEKP
jgi:Na+/phosphate symporter